MPRVLLGIFCMSLLAGGAAAMDEQSSQIKVDELRLIPFPKQVTLHEGSLLLAGPWVIELPPGHETLGEIIDQEWRRAGLSPLQIKIVPDQPVCFYLFPQSSGRPEVEKPLFQSQLSGEEYVLLVFPEGVVGYGGSRPGLFYAGMTFCQLLRANRQGNNRLPLVDIRDWPSLRWRCFQDDLTRGPSTTLPSLERSLQLGAYFKFNLWTYYMEYQYAFRKHPEIGPPDGSLQPEELAALVEEGQRFCVDILGNQQSFGHFGRILRHEKFAHLREQPHLLTPVREETYQLLDDLYSEVCPLLPFPLFNVCCDETWGLGEGPSKELAQQIGVGGVYVRHIQRLHALLREKYGKRMMMWGDIILQHPDHLKDIPPDVVMLTWNYSPLENFDHLILPFRKAGFEFFVCPGIHNWSRILPDFGVAAKNIQNFIRDGTTHGASGVIITDWEDDGEALQGYRWHGHPWGAECAWNGGQTSLQEFHRRLGAVLFGERGDHFGRAIELLSQTHRLPNMQGMSNSRFWREDFLSAQPVEDVRQSAERLLELVRPAIAHLEACRQEAVVNADLLGSFLHGARRMELIGRRMLAGLEVRRLYRQAGQAPVEECLQIIEQIRSLVCEIKKAHLDLGEEFARLWLADCKPYALQWTMSRYRTTAERYDQLLARLEEAKAAVRRGKPLPPAEVVGLVSMEEKR